MSRHRSALWATCLIAGSLALTACGGGGSSSAPTPTPSPAPASTAEGVYGGTLTGNTTASGFEMLVLENDEFWTLYGSQTGGTFYVSGFVQGTGKSSNGSFSASDARDFGSAPAIAGTVNANYSAGAKTISGTVSGSRGAIGFSGGPISGSLYNYQTPATLSSVTGSWSLTALSGEGIAMTVAASGSFTAVSASGCTFSGTVTPRPSGKNVFNVALNFGPAPCALPNQPANGIALTHPLTNGKSQLLVAVNNAARTMGTAAFGTR